MQTGVTSNSDIQAEANMSMERKTITAGRDNLRRCYQDHAAHALERSEQKQRIVSYWTRRSDGFARQREAELESRLHERWLGLIGEELWTAKPEWRHMPSGKCGKTAGQDTGRQLLPLKILDVGTGSGFFAILLSLAGHQVTGIDLTESMVRHADELALRHRCGAEFFVMDAENLDFQDESFDVVISRNLTWTLPNPEQAYREWMRVLKPGGVLLNYDADYGKSCFTQPESELPPEHAHRTIEKNMMQECQDLKDGLAISRQRRPQWDEDVIHRLGYGQVCIRKNISERLYLEKNEFYNPDPLFSLRVIKEEISKANA